jgi:hypothetical protein
MLLDIEKESCKPLTSQLNRVLYIVDLSVVVRNIDCAIVKILGKNPTVDNEDYNRLLKSMLCVHLCNPPHLKELGVDVRFAVVLVKDTKPYWRSKVYDKYKANRRKVPEQLFTRLKYSINMAERIIDAFKLGYSVAYDNFEADDIAAAYAKKWRDGLGVANCILAMDTIDTDWCGLIDDRFNIIWIDSNSTFTPYVRDEQGFQIWCNNKNPVVKCKHPSDIYKWKQKKGDPSDNLPANCDINLVDLISPNVNLFTEDLPTPNIFHDSEIFTKILAEANNYIAKQTNDAKLKKYRQLRV